METLVAVTTLQVQGETEEGKPILKQKAGLWALDLPLTPRSNSMYFSANHRAKTGISLEAGTQ